MDQNPQNLCLDLHTRQRLDPNQQNVGLGLQGGKQQKDQQSRLCQKESLCTVERVNCLKKKGREQRKCKRILMSLYEPGVIMYMH